MGLIKFDLQLFGADNEKIHVELEGENIKDLVVLMLRLNNNLERLNETHDAYGTAMLSQLRSWQTRKQ